MRRHDSVSSRKHARQGKYHKQFVTRWKSFQSVKAYVYKNRLSDELNEIKSRCHVIDKKRVWRNEILSNERFSIQNMNAWFDYGLRIHLEYTPSMSTHDQKNETSLHSLSYELCSNKCPDLKPIPIFNNSYKFVFSLNTQKGLISLFAS